MSKDLISSFTCLYYTRTSVLLGSFGSVDININLKIIDLKNTLLNQEVNTARVYHVFNVYCF